MEWGTKLMTNLTYDQFIALVGDLFPHAWVDMRDGEVIINTGLSFNPTTDMIFPIREVMV